MNQPSFARALKGLVALLALAACASPGGAPASDSGYPVWPPGHYDLRATISYRMDTEASTRTERAEQLADLVIGPEGSMRLQSSSGLCRQRTQEEIDRDRARGGRVFPCQEARYHLRPLGATVGGEVQVTVSEGFRQRGACTRYEQTATGGRVCVEYRWNVILRTTTKTASLRVTERS